jgi:hypothetical protein
MPVALLKPRSRDASLVIRPFSQRKARRLPNMSSEVGAHPTICPAALIPVADESTCPD